MNGVKLIDSILKDMEYIGLLLSDRKYVSPLNTFNLVIGKLNKLKVMLDTEYFTPDQIREAIRRLEKPIVRDDLNYPTRTRTYTPNNEPCDSVGTEKLY